MSADFVGRQRELDDLKSQLDKRVATLVVIKGRRRIGKSRLTEEFAKSFKSAFIFSGLAPASGITADDQKNEFIRLLQEYKIPRYSNSNDWGDLFFDLAQHTKSGKVLLVLDEITWMSQGEPTFLSKLKSSWDLHFKKNNKLILILSGSNSAWISKNILSSTGFFGRISYRLTLGELPLHQCDQFWYPKQKQISAYEKLKLLAITGGVPRYLEEIQPNLSAEENIKQLCFQKEGLLFNEFDEIFSDLFSNKSERYKSIIYTLANGETTVEGIAKKLGRSKGGDLSEILAELTEDGFISRDFSWHIKSGKVSKISRYRLSDNYMRFYIKYILPNKHRIEIGNSIALPPAWETIMGLQFENLVINNRKQIHDLLNIKTEEIVFANPYLQTQTKERKKCQVDYMIQTKFNTIYVCEIKFSKSPIDVKIIRELEEKISRLQTPKGFSCRPVLIHVNGISDNIIAKDYFSTIIDFAELLNQPTNYV